MSAKDVHEIAEKKSKEILTTNAELDLTNQLVRGTADQSTVDIGALNATFN